ncbi:MAG: glycosyltransferase [Mariniblastus sp.]|nr:glycosyltransferase [Mariniblastus sp.]
MAAGLALIAVFAWCGAWARAWWHARQYQEIPRLDPSPTDQVLESWPRLSLVIPACNEEGSIEAAAHSLIEQTYPNLQLIFINDRSSDQTGSIIDRLAESDSRVTPLHIETLPDGWLGKVHALHRAMEVASGDWLLFTDADITFEPNALQEIIQFAELHQLDHLAGLPRMKPAGFWVGLAIAAFYTTSMFFVSARRVADPDDPLAVGVGALNLVRRTALAKTPGFEWLKMETIDDMGLGLMVKRSGGRSMVARAGDQVSLHWYQNVQEMAGGLEKNTPGLTRYSRFRAAGLLSILPCSLVGFACTLIFPWPLFLAAWLLILACPLLCMMSFARQTSLAKNSFLFFPIGLVLLWLIFVRALWLLSTRGGVQWRGTLYTSEALKAGQRMEFPVGWHRERWNGQ